MQTFAKSNREFRFRQPVAKEKKITFPYPVVEKMANFVNWSWKKSRKSSHDRNEQLLTSPKKSNVRAKQLQILSNYRTNTLHSPNAHEKISQFLSTTALKNCKFRQKIEHRVRIFSNNLDFLQTVIEKIQSAINLSN